MAFRKVPGYITKGRAGYVLQRAVPTDVQPVIGKAKFKESGGSSLREARPRVSAFLVRTDREIAIARGQLSLSVDEQIERITQRFDLKDPVTVDLLVTGAYEDSLTESQRSRLISLATGESAPVVFYGPEDLLSLAVQLKSPAKRTEFYWRQELSLFLDFCAVASPLSCTTDHSLKWRSHLLSRVSANTTKTRIAYLSGLWSILQEERPDATHIFRGLTKRIKAEAKPKNFTINPVSEWEDDIYLPLFKAIYYSGARLAEIAGLRGQDLLDDRIIIQPHTDRSLKSKASARQIPMHPHLTPVLRSYHDLPGLIWPELQSIDGRWGANLSRTCKKVTGATPHCFRHRAATRLREMNFNEATICSLLGHTPNTITAGYGSIPWERLVDAVKEL